MSRKRTNAGAAHASTRAAADNHNSSGISRPAVISLQKMPFDKPNKADEPFAVNTGSQPAQRVKIKLKDEDAELMSRLRTVPVQNQGAQAIDGIGAINTLIQIGQHESIVFEGHGYYDAPLIGASKVVSQGGYSPRKLAELAQSVPKPVNWDGNIVLLGCSTGDITEKVSQEYYKLTQRPTKVIGTNDNIRVGSHWDDSTFVGTDWEKFPPGQRPADLLFVRELEETVANFWARVKQLIGLNKQIISFKQTVKNAFDNLQQVQFLQHGFQQTFTAQTVNVQEIFTGASAIKLIDGTSKHPKTDGKEYGLNERRQLYDYFADVIREMGNLANFNMPNTLQFIVNVNAGDRAGLRSASNDYSNFKNSLDTVLGLLQTLSNQGTPIWTKLTYYLKGLTLKEIDLTDPLQSTHHKKERTATSIFGDTWAERP